jgi:hypothetical protein
MVLADVRYEDAREAVLVLAARQAFVAPADIIAEVRRIRAARLVSADRVTPDVDPDDVAGWIAARREQIVALADGRIEAPSITAEGMDPRLAAALPGVFRRPPRPGVNDFGSAPLRALRAVPESVGPDESARIEAERARQLAELAELMDEDQ